jgi:hypothetical protein
MLQPDPMAMLVGVVLVVAVLAVLVAATAFRRRRERDFEVRPLPADRVQPYRERLDELETLFVTRPRHAVAGARQLVDDMLAQMGYPARLGRGDRVRDIAFTNRGHAKRYRTAVVVDDRSTTEEMRRAMEQLLAMGRELLADSAAGAPAAPETPTRRIEAPADQEPQPAGRPAGESGGERRFAG